MTLLCNEEVHIVSCPALHDAKNLCIMAIILVIVIHIITIIIIQVESITAYIMDNTRKLIVHGGFNLLLVSLSMKPFVVIVYLVEVPFLVHCTFLMLKWPFSHTL